MQVAWEGKIILGFNHLRTLETTIQICQARCDHAFNVLCGTNSSLDLRFVPQEGTFAWSCESAQKFRSEEFLGPRGELSSTV